MHRTAIVMVADRPARTATGIAAVALGLGLGLGLAPPEVQAAETPGTLDKVEVSGSAGDNRKDSSAAKATVTSAELAKYGDTNLTDALQRLPGVSVERVAGKDPVIRLRGLGAGYTQLLVNGEPMPPGFSIDAIAPQLIERIEVLRTATADMSAQAIAGTINIVLKQASPKRPGELKLGAGLRDGQWSPSITVERSAGTDRFSYGIGAGISEVRDRWPSQSLTENSATGDASPQVYRTQTLESQRETKLNLTPSLSWKSGDSESVTLNAVLQRSLVDFAALDHRIGLEGDAPDYARDRLTTTQRTHQARLSAAWKRNFGKSARIEAKGGLSRLSRTSDSHFDATDDATPLLFRDVEAHLLDRSANLRGKFSLSLNDRHSLALGWDAETGRRVESRIQVEDSPAGLPTQDLSEDYSARVSRVAVFAQDEWEVSEQFSAYLGIRQEVLSTRTLGNVMDAVRSRSSAVSPTAQLLWRVPDTKGDQVRLSAAHTFKAPTTKELIPRRWVVNQNSATLPNFRGNPTLRPEEAWGMDLGYERYLRDGAFIGVNAFARHIRRVVLGQVQLIDGAWTETPVNVGNAKVLGLELEAKGKLKQWLSTDKDVELRGQVARYWSELSALPSPGNRLNRQPPWTATIGADWSVKDSPLVVGANMVFEHGGLSRLTAQQSVEKSSRRLLDAYARYKYSDGVAVRLSLTNLLAQDDRQTLSYVDPGFSERTDSVYSAFRTVRLMLELKL